jgi:hypothetical protein
MDIDTNKVDANLEQMNKDANDKFYEAVTPKPYVLISEGPEYDAWVQRWKDAGILVETDALAALKEGKALIKEAANPFDYKEVLDLMKPFTKVMVEHNLMIPIEGTPSNDHNREGCEICELMISRPEPQENNWSDGSEVKFSWDNDESTGCGGNCECNCN